MPKKNYMTEHKSSMVEMIVDECVNRWLKNLISEARNNLQTVPLSKELIADNATESNWLNHMKLDADGIAYMDGNTVVGYIGYKGTWIIGIWVKPSFRRKQLGSKLIKHALHHGAYRASVNKQNITSLNFFQKNGFEIYKFDTSMFYLKKQNNK